MTAKQPTNQNEDTRVAILNLLEDLSIEKSRAEQAKANDEAILQSMGEGLIATDENEKITLTNTVANEIFGFKEGELLGTSITDLLLLDDAGNPVPLANRPSTLALSSGTIIKASYNYVRKDKTLLPIAIIANPIKLNGKAIGLIETVRDIKQEREIDRAKTEFVSLASHQLRTPLTAISWYTEMVLTGEVGSITPKQKKYLEQVNQGNQRMILLVNTLLNVSRIELGTFLVETKLTDVIQVAQDSLDEQKSAIEHKNIKISSKFDKDVPKLLTDPNQLHMVFQNLITNAVTYSPAGGRVELTISYDKTKQILIKISDTGYGIPSQQKNKIFTKFFRADNVREKNTEGTGLGLYIVKSIVIAAGGKIWFDSEENKGTTFYVTLPTIPLHNNVNKK